MYTGGTRPAVGGLKAKKQQVAQEQKLPTRLVTGRQEEVDNDLTEKPWWKAAQEDIEYSEWQELQTPEGLTYYYNVDTGETTWDKPDALKTDAELARRGDWVWMPDPNFCFVPARICNRLGIIIMDYRDAKRLTLETEDGQQHVIKASTELEQFNLAHLQRIVPDLVLLDAMSAPLILYNLRKRFEDKREIYTSIGTILISINPYQGLPLYTPEVIERYNRRGCKELPPHVFGVAADALWSLKEFGINQSIIISGESGAGKTEATKQCLSYLASVCGSISNVEQKILLSNPILESFGNAKTVRNDNSSRFGKYIEVFLSKGKLCGAYISNYLLEKIRIVYQQADERTFHIFYQLTEGCHDQQLKQRFGIGRANQYHYLNQSGCTKVDSIDDTFDFKETLRAMSALDFSQNDQQSVFRTVMTVLNIGNITFKGTGDRKCGIKDLRTVEAAARLLQVNQPALVKCLTIRMLHIKGILERWDLLIKIGQQSTEVPLSVEQAEESRDALAKFIYDRMFDWIVQKINLAVQLEKGSNRAELRSIGILDIFGFEIFGVNSFEQLCINFTNEKLQQLFNQTTFKLEEQVYRDEGIKFQHVEFIDNQPVLDLIEKAPSGLLPMLDEELRMPKGSDATFLHKAVLAYPNNPNFAKCLKAPDHFTVKHYAGYVEYDTKGFLEKNRDTLTEDLSDLVRSSQFSFLVSLFGQTLSTAERKASLGKIFRGQLYDLSNALHQTEPHYIRTIKPNPDKAPFVFEAVMVNEQLTYSGVFEAVRIRRMGYPFRLPHSQFLDRYKIVCKSGVSGGDIKSKCLSIIKSQKLDTNDVQVGRTMVLYRAPIQRALELQRSIIMVQAELDEALTRLCNKDPNNLSGIKWNRFLTSQLDPEGYFEELSKWVLKANEFNLKTPVSEQARVLLFEYIEARIDPETRALLEEAKAAVNQEMLEYAVAQAEAKDYDTNLIRECKVLCNRVRRINEEGEIAVETLQEKHMEVCLNAAYEIGMNTETLEYFDQLFNNTSPEIFVKEQMKAAVRLGDQARAIRLTVRLKAQFLSRSEADFKLPNYSKMKLPEYWASEKWLGLAFNQEEMKNGMFIHSSHGIHAPLLDLEPNASDFAIGQSALGKLAVQCFKRLQVYMGDRVDDKCSAFDAAKEILEAGIKHPELRDELYMHVMKQLTRNSNPESVRKGWDMLGLLCITFAPQTDFESYIEVFIRQNCPEEERESYIGAMHSIAFNGAKTFPPSNQEMADVRNAIYTFCDAFAEPLPFGVPSYQDLTEPYLGLTEDQVLFVRKTPKGRVKKKQPNKQVPAPKAQPKPKRESRIQTERIPDIPSRKGKGQGLPQKSKPPILHEEVIQDDYAEDESPVQPQMVTQPPLKQPPRKIVSEVKKEISNPLKGQISRTLIKEEKKQVSSKKTVPMKKVASTKQPPKPKPITTPWKEYLDDASGCKYYYNEETGESSWEPPPEFAYNDAYRQTRASSRGGWS